MPRTPLKSLLLLMFLALGITKHADSAEPDLKEEELRLNRAFFLSGIQSRRPDRRTGTRTTDLCYVDHSDPFEPHVLVSGGKFDAYCVDPTWRRPVRGLSPQQIERYRISEGYQAFANVNHHHRFHIAAIPNGDVVEEVLVANPRNPVVGPIEVHHAMIHFKFRPEKPVVLIPQSPRPDDQEFPMAALTVTDLVFDPQPVPPLGADVALLDKAQGNFPFVRAFVTPEVAYEDRALKEDGIRQLRLDLDPAERRKLLDTALRRSSFYGSMVHWELFGPNCMSETIATLDEAIDYRRHGGRAASGSTWDPSQLFYHLAARGLLRRGETFGPTLKADVEK